MKVSEITVNDVANYIRVELDADNTAMLTAMFTASKKYMSSYTGLPEESEEDESLDTYEEFYIVVMILCQDMYDNRTLYVDSKQLNRTVETILNMHRRNLAG